MPFGKKIHLIIVKDIQQMFIPSFIVIASSDRLYVICECFVWLITALNACVKDIYQTMPHILIVKQCIDADISQTYFFMLPDISIFFKTNVVLHVL